MSNFRGLRNAERYIARHEQSVDETLPQHLRGHVVSGIHRFASRYFGPVLYDLCEALPVFEHTELEAALNDDGDNELINLPSLSTAFSRCESQETGRSAKMFLPLEGTLLKMVATSRPLGDGAEDVSMRIARYRFATEAEAVACEERLARSGRPIEPGAGILVPRRVVRYSQSWDDDNKRYECLREDYAIPVGRVSLTHDSVSLQPQESLEVHQAFMSEARFALQALRTL